VVAAVALAGCGSVVPGTATTAGPNSSGQLPLAECMRSHGVPNFPDPTEGPGGPGFPISATPGSPAVTIDGTTFTGPAFESAAKTCELFGRRTAPAPLTASRRQAVVAFAECMRRHGLSGYPDPGPGRKLPSGVSPDSPAFQRAAAACRGH
jgi:hypothetical protein